MKFYKENKNKCGTKQKDGVFFEGNKLNFIMMAIIINENVRNGYQNV